MSLITPDRRLALRANAVQAQAANVRGCNFDPVPLVKLFNPVGAATWLATELYDDGDTLFGLADLGFGCPELGCFSLSEIAALRLPFGLAIKRNLTFATTHRLSRWADVARHQGSISRAEGWLWLAELPPRQMPDPLPFPDPEDG